MKRIVLLILFLACSNMRCAESQDLHNQTGKSENRCVSILKRSLKIAGHATVYSLLAAGVAAGTVTTAQSIHPYISIRALPHTVDLIPKADCSYEYRNSCDGYLQNFAECQLFVQEYNHYIQEACEVSFFYETPDPVVAIATDSQLIPGVVSAGLNLMLLYLKAGYDAAMAHRRS